MLGFVIVAVVIGQIAASVNPESLKPCFERYDGHKLIHAQPFHSEWKMNQEENCLGFCAQATSRCRSIVYDKISHICHYFMVDGVELRKVFPQRGMVYFQLADPNCAAEAIAKIPTEVPTTTEYSPPVTEVENGEAIPVMFAPENFPQPPTPKSQEGEKETGETPDFSEDADLAALKPPKKYPKFDEKIDKTRVDEVVSYDDDGNLIQFQTAISPITEVDSPHNQGHAGLKGFEDIRVPQGPETETTVTNEQTEKPDDTDYHETTVKEDPSKDYDPEPITAKPTPTYMESFEPTTFEPETATLQSTESTKPPTTTPDPRDAELKNLQEQMRLLEKEVLQIREEEEAKKQKFNPKLQLPRLPMPNPMAFMEQSVPAILPEMKVFKVARKELGSDVKASPDIRRAPAKLEKISNFKPLATAFASALNADFKNEDVDCPKGSNFVWIGVENSDLPRIGDQVTKKAQKVEECMMQCPRIRINGHVCNTFAFNEKRNECTYGFEEDMFGVKPAKALDYSTRAFKKLCYPESMSVVKDCAEFLAFRDYKLDVAPKEVFDGLPAGREGVSGCVELCILSTTFKCKSASFDFSSGQCLLFDKYSLSSPESFKEHKLDTLLYFENGCSIEPGNIKPEDIKEARVQRAVSGPSSEPLTPVRINFRKMQRA